MEGTPFWLVFSGTPRHTQEKLGGPTLKKTSHPHPTSIFPNPSFRYSYRNRHDICFLQADRFKECDSGPWIVIRRLPTKERLQRAPQRHDTISLRKLFGRSHMHSLRALFRSNLILDISRCKLTCNHSDQSLLCILHFSVKSLGRFLGARDCAISC